MNLLYLGGQIGLIVLYYTQTDPIPLEWQKENVKSYIEEFKKEKREQEELIVEELFGSKEESKTESGGSPVMIDQR